MTKARPTLTPPELAALDLMQRALTQLDHAQPASLAACRLQHAIDTLTAAPHPVALDLAELAIVAPAGEC